MDRTKTSSTIRGIAAVVCLAALAAVVGRDLVPDVAPLVVVAYAFGGAAAVLSIVSIATVASLQARQAVLRKGGTDAAWFWFDHRSNGPADARRRPDDRDRVGGSMTGDR